MIQDRVLPTLRTLLEERFLTPGDFEAFFGDHFPAVQRLCGTGMDRTQQIAFLLSRVMPHQIVAALMENFRQQPAITRQIEENLAAADSEEARAEYAVNQTILELSQELAVRRAKNVPIEAIAQKLREQKRKRRELREGPGLRPGHELGGRYKLLMPIGRGGFATVWQALDFRANLLVAIKVLSSELALTPRAVERFERGARTLLTLRHGHIIGLLDGPERDQSYHYTVLEYAAGGDLETAVLTLKLPTAEVMTVVLQAAEALCFAHAQGLVHRDVKPANILRTIDGKAKLTDFDLVHDETSTGGTRTGAMGTLLYAAPEQRDDASRVDERADIYSLGMTTIFALYGQRLPSAMLENEGRLAFIARLSCPKPVRDVLRKAVEADPEKRYQRMSEFVAELRRVSERWLSPPTAVSPGRSPRLSGRAYFYLTIAAAGGGIGVVAGLWLSLGRPPGALLPVTTSSAQQDLGPAAPAGKTADSGPVPEQAPVAIAAPTVLPGPAAPQPKGMLPPPKPAKPDAARPMAKPAAKRLPTPKDPAQKTPGSSDTEDDPIAKMRELEAEQRRRAQLSERTASPSAQASGPSKPRDGGTRPTDSPTKPPEKSAGPPEKSAGPPEKSAELLMEEAQQAYIRGERQRAIELGLEATRHGGADAIKAWRFVGSAACSIRHPIFATRAYENLPSPEHRQLLVELCKRNGLFFQDDKFLRED